MGEEIKQQKIRIAQSIEASKKQAFDEKRAHYEAIRQQQFRTLHMRVTSRDRQFGQTTALYKSKVD